MSRKKARFYIGQCVEIRAKTLPVFKAEESRRYLLRYPFLGPEIGWVVGCTWRFEGRLVDGYIRYDYGGPLDDKPNYLTDLKKVMLWKVLTKSMSQKPVEVMDEDIDAFNIYPHSKFPRPSPYLPLKYSKPPSERDRKLLSEDSKYWSRDKKGRWVKTDPESWLVMKLLDEKG